MWKLSSAATHFPEIFHMNIGSSCAAKDKRKWTVAAGAKDNTQCEKVLPHLLLGAQRERERETQSQSELLKKKNALGYMKHTSKKINCFVPGEGVEGLVIAFWCTSKLETSKSQFCCKVTITWLSGGIFCLVLKMFSETRCKHTALRRKKCLSDHCCSLPISSSLVQPFQAWGINIA